MKIRIVFFLLCLSLMSVSAQEGQYPKIDFKKGNGTLEINPVKQNIKGRVTYVFEVNQLIDTVRLDAKKMVFDNVILNGKSIAHKVTDRELLLFEGYHKGINTLSFDYESFPVQAMYFVQKDYFQDVQIWTQGQGKFTSHWFPSLDDVNDKVIFGLEVSFPKEYTVLSNGPLLEKIEKEREYLWKYQMQNPMSSYLLMLAIGRFEKQIFTSDSGIENQLWIHYTDRDKAEATYRYSQMIFDYLEQEIGYPYPWQVYLQVPVWDFMYGGMENTTATIFSQDYVVDSIGFNDRNYVNVNAHELAHQWFGNLVTAREGKHHWLQEGFATYYALLAEEKVFGIDHFYWKLYENAQKIEKSAQSDTIPILNEKASSLSFYQKGAWALHVIRENVGAENFRKAVLNYLKKHAYKSVVTADFFEEIKAVSDFDCEDFSKRWLESSEFQTEEVYRLLSKNDFMKSYLELQKNPMDPRKDRKKIQKILSSKVFYPIKELLIYQIATLPFEQKSPFLETALRTQDIRIRQAVAVTLSEIPENFRGTYESLLDDASYITREVALFNLWNNFPEHRSRYVALSENWKGFEGNNLEVLHHALSFMTTEEKQQKRADYQQLLKLSGTNYEATIRQNALEQLLNLNLITPEVCVSLAYGITHFRWRFALFCRDKIESLCKEEEYLKIFKDIVLPALPYKEKHVLERLLDKRY